jgi:hypothetical protein
VFSDVIFDFHLSFKVVQVGIFVAGNGIRTGQGGEYEVLQRMKRLNSSIYDVLSELHFLGSSECVSVFVAGLSVGNEGHPEIGHSKDRCGSLGIFLVMVV